MNNILSSLGKDFTMGARDLEKFMARNGPTIAKRTGAIALNTIKNISVVGKLADGVADVLTLREGGFEKAGEAIWYIFQITLNPLFFVFISTSSF